MNGLVNKVAIVTGGAQGIGAETVRAFVREGVDVVIADVLDAEGQALVDTLNHDGGQVIYVHTDVSSEADVRAMVETTIKHFGQIDFAVNNAGIGGAQAFTADYALSDWQRVIDVNLTGVFLCMRYEIREMLKNGDGVIVNVSSILGSVGFAGAPAYVAAKHAVNGLTKTAALEYGAKGIRVNAVAPAFIKTPMIEKAGMTEGSEVAAAIAGMHALKRLGTPNEVAELIVWLCSASASFMTGSAILVDGGYVAQ